MFAITSIYVLFQLDDIVKLFKPTDKSGILNVTPALEHHIDTGDSRPVIAPQYPMSPAKAKIANVETRK